MGNGASMTIALKLLAIAYILTSASRRPHDHKHPWIVSSSIVASVMVAYVLRDGLSGVLFSIAGLAVSAVFSVPLYRHKCISYLQILDSLILGSILGPVGYTIAFVIAFTLFAIQYYMRIDHARGMDSFPAIPYTYGPDFITGDEKSALAKIEARRILHGDERLTHGHDWPSDRGCADSGVARSSNDESMLPWGAKIAIAALVVLMMGVPF